MPDIHLKFGTLTNDGHTRHDYGNVWSLDEHATWSRLVIGPSGGHIDLLLALAKALPPPYVLLWVLKLPCTDRTPGRYESPAFESYDELATLLRRYRDYFEHDGCHHLWVFSPYAGTQLIYDNHEVIYAYGEPHPLIEVLSDAGFTQGSVEIPSPHFHGYNPANADTEDAFFSECDWKHFPLVDEHDDP